MDCSGASAAEQAFPEEDDGLLFRQLNPLCVAINTDCAQLVAVINMPVPVRYHFTQHFKVPARQAYNWCTDYDPQDRELMGDKNGKRLITPICESTVILTDTFQTEKGMVEKQKLVALYPDRLAWVATHLAGPSKYSQFLYKIFPEGEGASRLEFTALYLDYSKEAADEEEIKRLADELRKSDAGTWRLLAEAMEKELSARKL